MANAKRKVSAVTVTTPVTSKVTGMDYSNASHLVTAIARIKEGGVSIKEGLELGCFHIMALTTMQSQKAASKALAEQLIALEKHIDNTYATKLDSAIKRVQRKVKQLNPKFVWALSHTEVAKKKAAQRAKKEPKAESKGKIVAVKKSTPEQIIDGVVIQMRKIQSETENLIPAGNLEAYRSAFVAFIATIKTLTK